jgi:pimeloyl-ACP methyl ester carboxylesterase
MRTFIFVLGGFVLLIPPAFGESPRTVSIPTSDGGLIAADLYGEGTRGVVLAHGGRFDRESWAPQARALAADGFRVLAIDFRGYGPSRGPGGEDPLSAPLHLDVLAAVRYLRAAGAKSLAVVGGSMGGTAAADADAMAPGEIDRLILLGCGAGRSPASVGGRKLFLVARDDPGPGDVPRLTAIRAAYEAAPPPKELIVLEGSAHAQAIFGTAEGGRAMCAILDFLSRP